jgi:hypothetical protein
VSEGQKFIADVEASYDLSPHEERLIQLAGQALDRAVTAGDEFTRYVEEHGTVLLSGKAHPASIVARDSARAFELLCRSAALPADATGDSVRRLRDVSAGA